MSASEEERSPSRTSRPAGRPRRLHCDRYTAIAASAAVLALVALIAMPAVVESPGESGADAPVASGVPAKPAAAEPVEPLRAVCAVLAPAAKGPKPNAVAMAKRLGGIGAGAIPVVVGMLCGDVPAPAVAEGTADQPIHPEALARREQVLFASLQRFRSKDVVAHLRSRAPTATYETRLVLVRLLGEVGTPDAMNALVDLLSGFEPMQLQRDYLKTTVEGAIARCIAQDPASLQQLSRASLKVDRALIPLLARGVGRTRGPASAAYLARLLGKSREMDLVAAQELARVTETSGIALPDTSLADVRRLLEHPDRSVQRTAATVLGRLCDRASFDALVLRLEDRDKLVCAAARWSLRSMAQSDLGAAPAPWIAWREQQDAWWNLHGTELLEELRSSDSAQVFASLKELVQHPFYKHESARAIGPLASSPQAAIALSAISTLQRLGSPQAAPWLIESLTIDDERRAPATAALQALTGLKLAGEYALWSKALPTPGMP